MLSKAFISQLCQPVICFEFKGYWMISQCNANRFKRFWPFYAFVFVEGLKNDLIDTVTLPRSFLSVLFLGVCLNVAATLCVWYAFFLCTDYYWEMKRTIFFTADIWYRTVTAGDIFSICTSRICFCLFEAKTMLCKYRNNSQYFIFLWTRGINKVVFLTNIVCACVFVKKCPSFLQFFSLAWKYTSNKFTWVYYKLQVKSYKTQAIQNATSDPPRAQNDSEGRSLCESSGIRVWIQVRLMVRIGVDVCCQQKKTLEGVCDQFRPNLWLSLQFMDQVSLAVFQMAYLPTAYCVLPSTQCILLTIF